MPNFPSSGGASLPWLTNVERFVSPSGNDSNDGTSWEKAKRTLYAAVTKLAQTAGTLYVGNGVEVGGPVPGQGLRLRRDNIPQNNYYFSAPGFIPITGPMRIVGAGASQLNFGPVTASFSGGGTDAFNPAIQVVGFGAMSKLEILNLQQTNISNGAMIGIDHDRNTDGTVKHISIANAVRVGSVTVYTVTLPTAFTVSHAQRVSDVVTLTIPNPSPGLPWPPWRTGVPVSFVAGDSGVNAGDFTITTHSNPLNNNITWTISYSDPGIDVPNHAVTGATIKTHGCRQGEFIDVVSTNPHFLGTQYEVVSVTATTITVFDVFGDGDADQNNIGTLAHQERYYGGTTGFVGNFNLSINNDNPLSKHSVDIGHNAAIAPLITGGWYEGHVGNGTGPRDEKRMSAIFVNAGTTPTYGPPNASLTIRDGFLDNGSIYVTTGALVVGTVDVRRITAETNYVSLDTPVLQVDGGPYTQVTGQDLINADSDPTTPTVLLNSVPSSAAQLVRCGIVRGSCVGGDRSDSPSIWTATEVDPVTPWQRKQQTTWADLRIAGKHPASVRGFAPFTARYKNIIAAPDDWFLRAGSMDTDQPAPDGSNTAVKVTANGYVSIFPNSVTGDTWEVGGIIQVCGWINAAVSSGLVSDELFRVVTSHATFEESVTGSMPLPYSGTGWQFVSCFLTVATLTTTTPVIEIEFRAQVASVTGLWGMTAFYIPPGTANDTYEVLGTVHHQPRYLLPGQAGTMEGQPFFADGGFGPALTKTLGAANGRVLMVVNANGTLAGYVELKDEA